MFEFFFKDGGVIVWRLWVCFMFEFKKMRLGFVRFYFLFFVKFCEFVVDYVVNKVESFFFIFEDVFQQVGVVVFRFKGMCLIVIKEYVYVKWERQMEDE